MVQIWNDFYYCGHYVLSFETISTQIIILQLFTLTSLSW